jgi:NAD(P)-dependent dehydrogenase (short-subunit alcohol dehydrogenase family)
MSLTNYQPIPGRVVIVTGGNSGIGYEALKELARLQATVIMASRSEAKATAAIEALLKEIPSATVVFKELQLADLSSIKRFSEEIKQEYDRLDFLINNAGVMYGPYQTTQDGFEHQLGTNHLGHFALTGQLLPLLQSTPGSRIITVSSLAHRGGKMDFANLQFERKGTYSPQRAYGRSKLANLHFGYELDRRLKIANSEIKSIVVHPGVSKTNLFDQLASGPLMRRLFQMMSIFIQSAEAGALPTLYACFEPLQGGEYIGPDGFGEIKGAATIVKSSKASRNINDAKELWRRSEDLTSIVYPL